MKNLTNWILSALFFVGVCVMIFMFITGGIEKESEDIQVSSQFQEEMEQKYLDSMGFSTLFYESFRGGSDNEWSQKFQETWDYQAKLYWEDKIWLEYGCDVEFKYNDLNGDYMGTIVFQVSKGQCSELQDIYGEEITAEVGTTYIADKIFKYVEFVEINFDSRTE